MCVIYFLHNFISTFSFSSFTQILIYNPMCCDDKYVTYFLLFLTLPVLLCWFFLLVLLHFFGHLLFYHSQTPLHNQRDWIGKRFEILLPRINLNLLNKLEKLPRIDSNLLNQLDTLLQETIDFDCWGHKGFEYWITVVVQFVTIIVRRIRADTVQRGLIILLYYYCCEKSYLLFY